MIDSDGYRLNVGIIISNPQGQLLWCRRSGQDAWQFPQGGMEADETPEQALYRELNEETGLNKQDVTLLGSTKDWLHYDLPSGLVRKDTDQMCVGQKQIWFLLRLDEADVELRLDHVTSPEFDEYCWVDYWYPIDNVIFFKRDVYAAALAELEPCLATE